MRSLNKLDFRCEAARDGEHALELLRQQLFHIVITDLRMPRKHGFNLASEILKEFGAAGPAVVVYTGIEEPKLVSQLLTMGVEDVCIKPMNPDILATKVMSVCHRRVASTGVPQETGPSLNMGGTSWRAEPSGAPSSEAPHSEAPSSTAPRAPSDASSKSAAARKVAKMAV
jgi:DNA-binding response OmpR family regulator